MLMETFPRGWQRVLLDEASSVNWWTRRSAAWPYADRRAAARWANRKRAPAALASRRAVKPKHVLLSPTIPIGGVPNGPKHLLPATRLRVLRADQVRHPWREPEARVVVITADLIPSRSSPHAEPTDRR